MVLSQFSSLTLLISGDKEFPISLSSISFFLSQGTRNSSYLVLFYLFLQSQRNKLLSTVSKGTKEFINSSSFLSSFYNLLGTKEFPTSSCFLSHFSKFSGNKNFPLIFFYLFLEFPSPLLLSRSRISLFSSSISISMWGSDYIIDFEGLVNLMGTQLVMVNQVGKLVDWTS
ncbi:hypothetical protein ACE6H2_000843 [Prunus campanulata]